MVTIDIKDINGTSHYRLMGEGMRFDCGSSQNMTDGSCSTWVLSTLRTAPDEAIFENLQGQKVKVEL